MAEQGKIIVFQDIRDSTRLLYGNLPLPKLTMLLSAYYMALAGAVEMAGYRRGQYSLKTIGDGAMIALPHHAAPTRSLSRILVMIRAFQAYFPYLVESFNTKYGESLSLRFGWGVSMGPVQPLGQQQVKDLFDIAPGGASLLDHSLPEGVMEFIGPCIVRASRLCGFARPEGLVIDAEAFPDLPPALPFALRAGRVSIMGLGPLDVWASPTVEETGSLTLGDTGSTEAVHLPTGTG